MTTKTKAVKAANTNRAVTTGDLSARLAAFRAEMVKNGLSVRTGGKWVSIDTEGGFLIGTFVSAIERLNKKYSKPKKPVMETMITLNVQKGYGKCAAEKLLGIELKPGEYVLRADGNIPAWLARVEPSKGTIVSFMYKGKSEPSDDFPKGAKSYDIYDNEGEKGANS